MTITLNNFNDIKEANWFIYSKKITDALDESHLQSSWIEAFRQFDQVGNRPNPDFVRGACQTLKNAKDLQQARLSSLKEVTYDHLQELNMESTTKDLSGLYYDDLVQFARLAGYNFDLRTKRLTLLNPSSSDGMPRGEISIPAIPNPALNDEPKEIRSFKRVLSNPMYPHRKRQCADSAPLNQT